MNLVLVLLPKSGLGNKLYVWAQAYSFAHLNQLKVLELGWTQPSLRPIMRRERSNRLYLGQFRSPRIEDFLLLLKNRLKSKPIINPPLELFPQKISKNQLFIFQGLANLDQLEPDNSFQNLKSLRKSLKTTLYERISDQVKKRLQEVVSPVIGIHVRRGDFESTPWLTSLDYFIGRINQIREVVGKCLPVTVFSDGTDEELTSLLDMTEVKRALPNPDIVDLLLLSQSQVLVTCPASTFSNWAAFLSEGIIIRDYLFPHKSARPDSINETIFEGIPSENIDGWPKLLITNLQKLNP